MALNSDGATYSSADQSLTTVAGGTYFLQFEVGANPDPGTALVGTTQGASNIASVSFEAVKAYSSYFQATGTTTWIRFLDGNSTANVHIDNVSVQQIQINGNPGLLTNGPLFKSDAPYE